MDIVLNGITPNYEENGITFKSALQFFIENHISTSKKNKTFFVFNNNKPLLPQLEKALQEITKEDYFSYTAYLREGNIKHPLQELEGRALTMQDRYKQYMYLLLSDSKVLGDYLREGEEESTRPLTDTEQKALTISRMAKSGRLWEVITAQARILAGELYEKTIQNEILYDIDEITGKHRENRRYKEGQIDDTITSYDFNSGVTLYYDKSGIEKIDKKINELSMNTSKVLRILLTKTINKVPSKTFEGGTLKDFIDYTKVEISVDDYINYARKKDRKNAKKMLESGLNDLYNISIDQEGRFSKHRWISSLDDSRKRNGLYTVCFSPDMMGYICSPRTKIHDFNMVLLSLNENKKLAYQLGKKLWYQYMIMQGENGSTRLNIKKLINILTELPTPESIMANKKDGHLTAKIKEPFERALDDLVAIGYLNKWDYVKAKGEVIPAQEKDEATFDDWLTWYIEFDLHLPPQGKYIEAKNKAKERRKKKSETARKANKAKNTGKIHH